MFVLAAGLLEIVWAYSMELPHGFTRPVATTIKIFTMLRRFALLSMSMKTLPLGTACQGLTRDLLAHLTT